MGNQWAANPNYQDLKKSLIIMHNAAEAKSGLQGFYPQQLHITESYHLVGNHLA